MTLSDLENILAQPAAECLARGLTLRQGSSAFTRFMVMAALTEEGTQEAAAARLGIGQRFVSRAARGEPGIGAIRRQTRPRKKSNQTICDSMKKLEV